MKETKIEFLLKKILYYKLGGRQPLDKFNKWIEDEYEKECEIENSKEFNDIVNIKRAQEELEKKEDIDVAPLTQDEKNKLAEHKLFKRVEKYGFGDITLSRCKAVKLVADDTDGENFFAYLVKQKYGRIERKPTTFGTMSVKFIFNKEIRDKIYGEGKG